MRRKRVRVECPAIVQVKKRVRDPENPGKTGILTTFRRCKKCRGRGWYWGRG